MRAKRQVAATLLLVATAAAVSTADAQPVPANPVPQGSPIPRVRPPSPPSVAPGTVIPPPSAPGAEVPNRPVRVSSVEVEGVTAYPQPEIAQLAAGLIGPAVPLPQIDAARQAILQRYRSDGYVLTTVAANLDANGRLRFVVTEGRIASVKLDGDIGPAGTQVLRFLNRLTEKQPIDSVTLERYLLLAQDVPGVSLRAVLEPSADTPGALNLIAQVSRQKVSGLASYGQSRLRSNRADRVSWRGRCQQLHRVRREDGTLVLPHLPEQPEFRPGLHRGIYRRIGPQGEDLWRLRRHRPDRHARSARLQRHHDSVRQFAELSGDPLATADAERQSRVRRARLQHIIAPNGTPREQASYDALRVLRLGADYALSDLWLGADRSAINGLSVRFSQGMKLLGASTNGDSVTSPRVGEQTGFSKFNFEASRTQTLFAPWEGASVGLMELLTGQWSDNILPPAEQFYLGGSRFTRGYYAGQVPGDKALAATTEVQLNTSFETTVFDKAFDISTQYYLFYDWGETWQNLSTDHAAMINSAGGGVRAQVTRYVEVDFEGLARFNRFPNGGNVPGTGVSPSVRWRLLLAGADEVLTHTA